MQTMTELQAQADRYRFAAEMGHSQLAIVRNLIRDLAQLERDKRAQTAWEGLIGQIDAAIGFIERHMVATESLKTGGIKWV